MKRGHHRWSAVVLEMRLQGAETGETEGDGKICRQPTFFLGRSGLCSSGVFCYIYGPSQSNESREGG